MKKQNYAILKEWMIRSRIPCKLLLALMVLSVDVLSAQQITHEFNFSPKEVQISQADKYDVVTIKEGSFLAGEEHAGKPQLPVITFNLLLPKGAVATNVNISKTTEEHLPGTYKIHPVQLPAYPNFEDTPSFVDPNLAIYNSTTPFPQEAILDYSTNGYREFNYVSVSFTPFRYVPQSEQLYLLTDVNISVSYKVSKGTTAYKMRPYGSADQVAYEQVKKIVVNAKEMDTLYPGVAKKIGQRRSMLNNSIPSESFAPTQLPSIDGSAVHYVIITNNTDVAGTTVGNFTDKFQVFADWKTKSGNPAKVVTVDEIRAAYSGVDVAEKIRNFIKEAHQLWGTEYVLLGGGAAVVPVRWIRGTGMPTDLYYSAIYHPVTGYGDNWNADGDDRFGENQNSNTSPDYSDYVADIGVGRAPVDTNEEVDIFLKKNFAYARCSFAQNIPDGNWLGKQLMGYGSAFDVNWNSINALRIGYEIIQDHYDDIDIYGMFEYHEPRDLPCNDQDTWGLAYYPLHNDCTTNQVPIDDEDLLRDDFINQINSGYGVINILEHGGPYGLGLGKVTHATPLVPQDFQNLNDTHKYGILLAGGCHSAAIERDYYIGEQWVNAPGGGVAYIGASDDIGATASYNFNQEFFDVLHDENIFKLGKIPNLASLNLNSTYLAKIFQMLGDPELSIYTEAPTTLTVGHANTIPNGNQDFIINVSGFPAGELVRVCLYKENEVLGFTETATFPVTFDITPDTEGLMRVTATCHNKEPYEADVTIIENLGVHLYKSDVILTDENQNGYIEPGETIDLSIELSNTGATNATNITGLLTTSDLNTVISQANSNYPNILSGQSGTSLVNYTFTASVDNYVGGAIPFELLITASQGTFTEPFLLHTKSAQLELGPRSVLVDGNETNTFNAGDEAMVYVDIHNIGTIEAENVTAVLSTQLSSSIVSVDNGVYVYGNIASQSEVTNTTAFTVDIGPSYLGQDLVFELTLTDEFGKTDIFEFSLTEDYPPLITGFEYTSGSDFITPNWDAIQDINGYNIFRSDTETGTYEKQNDLLITSASMYNDLAVMALTGYWYKVSVVSLSGNELGVENLVPYYANTTLGFHGGFPIRAHPVGQVKAIAPPTVYDVDGNGTKEIFVNLTGDYSSSATKGRILGFYESGQEMFDIDGNQTEVWGFAATDYSLYAKSAVGDVDNNGEAEVFSVSRDPGILYGFHTVDNDNNQKPDPLWDNGEICIDHRTYRNPVLSDLNNNGFMEIIILDEQQRILVYDYNKNLLGEKQLGNEDYSLGEVAVADIDGDAYKEIIVGCEKVNAKGAIYLWNHDGDFTTNLTSVQAFGGKRADGGPILADLDNDGDYEILTIAKNGTQGYVYALNIEDGSYVNPNWGGSITIDLLNGQYQGHIIPRMAVGDLDNDGNLEVVFGSKDYLYVVDKDGNMLSNFPLNIGNTWDDSPILADIDGDATIEIIINVDGVLHAYNYDSTPCFGWPLQTSNDNIFVGTPFIGDIDNDGMNEVVISSEDYTTYAWDTPGAADRIEWASYRANAQNTAVYKEECQFSNAKTVIINGSNVAWTEDVHLQGDLIIKANSELTIFSEVTFTSGGGLIIEPGGKLTLSGGTLTTYCNNFWKGVTVKGNTNLAQTSTNQGVLILKNNARIERAETAIYVGNPAFDLSNNGGGIIKIKSSTFKDNIVGIEMLSYANENSSFVKGNVFETTDYLINRNKLPDAFLKFWEVGTIEVDLNVFKNLATIDPYTTPTILDNQGKGLVTNGADLEITNNTFENLHVAIEVTGTNASLIAPINTIDNNTFNDNWHSIKLDDIDDVSITSNKIAVFATYLDGGGSGSSCGLHITNANNFHIEANNFSSTLNYFSNGIFINDCRAENEIYKNWFTDLYTAVFAEGRNREPNLAGVEGLQLLCNKFDSNHTDVYVAPKSVIALHQGTDNMPAGNVFYPECSNSFKEFNNQNTLMYYSAENAPEFIPECNYNVSISYTSQQNTCPSGLGGKGLTAGTDVLGTNLSTSDRNPVRTTAIENFEGLNMLLEVSPNPASDYLFVECQWSQFTDKELILQIANSNGLLIKRIAVKGELTEISTASWSSGAYVISLFSDQKLIDTVKLIIN